MNNGYKMIPWDNEIANSIYSGTGPDGFAENEYLILYGEEQDDMSSCIFFIHQDGKFKEVRFPVLENDFTGKMKPRNPQQYCALDLIHRDDIPVKLITGKFGSGKSMAMIVGALEALQKNKFDKIIFVRNNVQVKDTGDMGALPGDSLEKTLPYLMPFADHCGGIDGVRMLIDQGKLEVIPLAYLRGRSIKNSILYSMESENLTKEHIQLILGRVDEGSQLWMDGDLKQRDKNIFDKSKGLEIMIKALEGDPLFGHVHLIKSERSQVAQLCDKMDEIDIN